MRHNLRATRQFGKWHIAGRQNLYICPAHVCMPCCLRCLSYVLSHVYHSTFSTKSSNASQIVSIAQSVPAFKWNPKDSKKRNPNKRRRWLIPLFIVAQVALKVSRLVLIQHCPQDVTEQPYVCSISRDMAIHIFACHDAFCISHVAKTKGRFT